MPRTALTLLLILIGSTCILPNVYGGKMLSRPNIILILTDDLGWSYNSIKTGLNRALDLVCVQNAYKLNAK